MDTIVDATRSDYQHVDDNNNEGGILIELMEVTILLIVEIPKCQVEPDCNLRVPRGVAILESTAIGLKVSFKERSGFMIKRLK